MFEDLKPAGVDQLMALMQAFKSDPRTEKVDLVVGVYKDDAGGVPVLKAVKAAEKHLVDHEETKNYVGVMGDPDLASLVPALLLGADHPALSDGRMRSLQSPGGSGALRLGCELLGAMESGKTLWVSTPTWANHIPVAKAARLTVAQYPYFRPSDRSLDFDGMMAHLDAHAKAGDAILLHACCHNPTGVDLSLEQWKAVTDLVVRKGLLPFVDSAYQGFGRSLDEDMAGLRHMAHHAREMLIANSFSKNFGIYRERTGAISVLGADKSGVDRVMAALGTIARTSYSMPPSHGARIVTTIMNDAALKEMWHGELETMRNRISQVRQTLREKLEGHQVTADVSFLTNQVGMFSYTGFSPEQVARLREEFGIFTAGDGRINVAGLSSDNVDRVAEGFAAVLR